MKKVGLKLNVQKTNKQGERILQTTLHFLANTHISTNVNPEETQTGEPKYFAEKGKVNVLSVY